MQAIQDCWTGTLTPSLRFYHRNKIKISADKKQERLDNIVLVRQKEKIYAAKYRKRANENNKQYKKRNPLRSLFHAAKKRAKDFNLPFEIAYEDILIPDFCPILGIKLEHNVGVQKDNSPSLDKIIPALGYTKTNTRVISYRANRYKSDMSLEVLERLVAYVKGQV